MSEACAQIVRRDDPQLFATAVMAPEPARSALMVLYAFDIELSRASQASEDPTLVRMRLQFWRDVINNALRDQPVDEHEVATPLAMLIQRTSEDAGLLDAMIDGHERELDAPFDRKAFGFWADERFGARLCFAINLLIDRRAAIRLGTRIGSGDEDLGEPGSDVTKHILPLGRATAAAFSIEHAERRASEGKVPLLPAISAEEIAGLGRGELPDSLRDSIRHISDRYVRQIAFSREGLKIPDKRMIPALLPLRRVDQILTAVRNPRFTFRKLAKIDRPFNGLRLTWRTARGNW